MSIATSTAKVLAVSDRLSMAVASMAAEWMRRPTCRLYSHMYSFTHTEAAMIPSASRENVTSSGCRILSREDLASSTPISRISPATIRPDMYSMRPWPKGWSVSGFLPARRKPSSVTAEEPASDRLLKASAVTAMEPDSCPAKNFPANSRMFSAIPTAPHRVPYARRTAGDDTLSRS